MLSVCKTKMFDRYGNYVINFAMVTYPGVKDIYEKEETMLLKEKINAYRRFKGTPISDMDKKDIKEQL